MGPVVLRGDEHTELGPIATAARGPRCALALSRGRHAKAYPHLDPNEDFVAASAGPEATLLVVADGHNGIQAADAAVAHLLATMGQSPPPPGRPEDELIGLLTDAGWAAWEVTRAHRYPRRGSRTALGFALAAGSRVQWAVVGDVAVLAVGPSGARVLNVLDEIFLGGPSEPEHVADMSDIGTVELEPGEWLVLASDGLLNFASLDEVGAAVAAHTDPEGLARALVEAAGVAGAGDNVAVAVLGPA